jgi:SAM-dependent methyltransferase
MEREGWDTRYATAELVWSAQPNQFVVEEFTGLTAGRALDLGCGEGRNTVWFATQGWRATGVDFAQVGIDKGRKVAKTAGVQVDWIVADLRDHEPPTGAFDAVLVAYLHLPAADLAAVLGRAAAALAPGGRLVVIGHDATNLRDGIGGPQDPAVLYTPDQITAGLPGLRIARAERARRVVTTPDGDRSAIDTVVRAVRD